MEEKAPALQLLDRMNVTLNSHIKDFPNTTINEVVIVLTSLVKTFETVAAENYTKRVLH